MFWQTFPIRYQQFRKLLYQEPTNQRVLEVSEPLRFHAIELEARVLYSAAPLDFESSADLPDSITFESLDASEGFAVESPTDWPVAESTASTEEEPISFEALRTLDSQGSASSANEVFFVDTSVEDYELLAEQIGNRNPNALLHYIDAQLDGLQQITDALASERDLQTIHLISHGSSQGLQLGSTQVTASHLHAYSDHFSAWGSAFASGADLLIYGCDVGAGEAGQQFLVNLADLTSADIAASTDLTGHAALGGDWDLELTVGQIQTESVFASPLESSWQSTLAAVNNIDDFVVNAASPGEQETSGESRGSHQAIALINGGSVVVYTDSLADGNGTGVFAQRLNSIGDLVGTAIQVNVDSSGDQANAVVAADASGRFAVAYTSSDGDQSGVYLRRFNADGTAIDANDILVNAGQTAGAQFNPALTVNDSGELVVAWQSDGASEGIYARTFDMDSATTSQLPSTLIQVDSNAASDAPSVDMNNAGRFVVAWDQAGEVYGRRYDYSASTALSARQDLNSGDTGSNVVVAVQEDSDFVIAFRVDGFLINGVWRRAFDATGAAQGGSEIVNLSSSSTDPSIAMATDGSFVVAYEANDGDGLGVYARKYDANSNSVGSRFQINSGTTSDQSQVSVALQDIDNFVAVWTGDESGSKDVYARQFGASQTLVVTTTADVQDGDVSSLSALLANKGADGLISLREAIAATNQTANADGLDEIEFDLPDTEGRFYYRDDGLADSLSLVATTTLAEGAIADFDPDYIGSPFSWYRIDLDNALPALTITDAVIIDGYSQSAAVENSSHLAFNAQVRVELMNSASDANAGLVFAATADNSVVQGLAIHSFGSHGVFVEDGAEAIVFRGNIIGADPALKRHANGGSGLRIHGDGVVVGGSDLADRNVISGNAFSGVEIRDAAMISGGSVENNIVDANANHGVLLQQTDGIEVLNNVVTGNAFDGIRALSGGSVINTTIQGNSIGVSADGLVAAGNAGSGIRLEADVVSGTQIGGASTGEGNVIGSNGFNGISIDGLSIEGTTIYGNFIGTNALETVVFANGLHGIQLTENAVNNQIGGVLSGQANVIANNAQAGVALINTGVGTGTGHGNSIRGNRFYNQGGLAIDLLADGVTNNDGALADADDGPNRLQNFPQLNSAVLDTGQLEVTGVIQGEPTTDYVIDFYRLSTSDSLGHGEADEYLGSISSADFATTDGNGEATFTFNLATVTLSAGEFVTATATHSDGSTSEFSANATVVLPNVAPVLGNNQLTINEGESVVIGTANLSATDADDDNSLLSFDVSAVMGGRFVLATDLATAITSFTQAQVTAGQVLFVDDGDENGPSYDVAVTDGKDSTSAVAANVSFSNANDAPVLSTNQLFVARGQTAAINSSNFSATDIDDVDVSLTYHISNISGGKFAPASNPSNVGITSFTQAQVNAGQIVFVDDGDSVAPSFEVSVSDGSLSTSAIAANVTFDNGDVAPVLNNNQLIINEGQTVTIGTADLSATDVDTSNETLTFAVSNVVGGRFALATDAANAITSFTQGQVTAGQIVFVDDGNEAAPAYDVAVWDGFNSTGPEAAVVAFGGVNDAPTLVNPIGSITVNEDAADRTIDLTTVFADSDDSSLRYFVVGNSNGFLVSARVMGSQLTLDFLPNQFGSATVTVQARDAAGELVDDVISVAVLPVNDRPSAVTKQYTLTEDGTASGSLLQGAVDVENDSLTPVVTRGPASGTVVLNPDGSFVYIAGDEFVGQVDFEYALTDGLALSESKTVTVVAPVVVAAAPVNISAVASDVVAEDSSDETTEDADETPEPVVKGNRPSPSSDEDEFFPSPEPRDAIFAEQIEEAGSKYSISFESESEIGMVCLQKTQLTEAAPVNTTQGVVQTISTMAVVSSDFSSALLSSVSVLQDDLESANQSVQNQQLTAVVSLSGVSIGVVTWILRSGAFVASMLANLPAWRMIDPLVVLGHAESDDGSDESLLDIVEDNQGSAPNDGITNQPNAHNQPTN